MSQAYDPNRSSSSSSIAWSAIFAGSLVSIVLYLLLSLLGMAVSTSVIQPETQHNVLDQLSMHAKLWTAVSIFVSIFAGAFIAGRAAYEQGALHGLLSWSITVLVGIWLLGSLANSVASGVFSIVGRGLSLAGQGVSAGAPSLLEQGKEALDTHNIHVDWGDLRDQLDSLLRDTGKSNLEPEHLKQQGKKAADDLKDTSQYAAEHPQQADEALKDWFNRVKQGNHDELNDADKEALTNLIAERTGKSKEEARALTDRYAKAYHQAMEEFQKLKQQAEEKARHASQVVSDAVAKAAWGSLAVLILSSLLSLTGGLLGFKYKMRNA